MGKDELIELLMELDSDYVQMQGRVEDEFVDIGGAEVSEEGTIVIRPM